MDSYPDPNAGGDLSTSEELDILYQSLESDEREAVAQRAGEVLHLLGREHPRAIIHHFAFENETALFSDLEQEFSFSSEELAERLQELTERGLLTRTSYDGTPPKTEYRVTEMTRDLYPVVLAASKWAMNNELE